MTFWVTLLLSLTSPACAIILYDFPEAIVAGIVIDSFEESAATTTRSWSRMESEPCKFFIVTDPFEWSVTEPTVSSSLPEWSQYSWKPVEPVVCHRKASYLISSPHWRNPETHLPCVRCTRSTCSNEMNYSEQSRHGNYAQGNHACSLLGLNLPLFKDWKWEESIFFHTSLSLRT